MKSGEDTGKRVIVADTNIFIHDPKAVDTLREGGNTLCLHWAVILELDNLKNRPDIGIDAREALRRIEEVRLSGDKSLILQRSASFRSLGNLDKRNPDHQIIATAVALKRDRKYPAVVLVSRDGPVRLLARELGLQVEDYSRGTVETPKFHLQKTNVAAEEIQTSDLTFPFDPEKHAGITENEGVVCHSDWGFESVKCGWKESFAAIRKGNRFKIISPDINALGVYPFSINGNGPNWSQHIALFQLLDSSIELVFLQGGAGSGKTLLALATAIEQKRQYTQIVVTRPMIHLEDEDRMGFLPGNEYEKMSPWLRPIQQALSFLKRVNDRHKDTIEKMEKEEKIDFVSLDFIRGMTFCKNFLIVDEAQNLTPHQVKTIVTRAGMDAKIIFTGDLGQIDRRRRLDEKSSGLAFAISRMEGQPRVGITTFKETVRSPLASLAEELL